MSSSFTIKSQSKCEWIIYPNEIYIKNAHLVANVASAAYIGMIIRTYKQQQFESDKYVRHPK